MRSHNISMAKRKRPYTAWEGDEEDAPPCEVTGCSARGLHKAPKSSKQLRDYYWLCLDHVREYNQSWDFFSGMSQPEVESFMKDAVTGHRPTWRIGTQPFYSRRVLEEAMEELLGKGFAKKQANTESYYPLTAKERRALAVLDLGYPVTAKELKAQYKKLVKRHHPDVNKGDKQSEEMFKRITAAYHLIATTLKSHNVS